MDHLSRAARIIIIGAPGVGKGTQTGRLLRRFPQLSSISSGDLLRDNVREKTPLGKNYIGVNISSQRLTHRSGRRAESKLSAGLLVPDTMILRLILNEFTTRGWLQDRSKTSYSLNSNTPQISDAELVDDAFITTFNPEDRQYNYSDEPSASFVLDGFPRTASQATQFDGLVPINFVVHISTPASIVLDRICNRWVHQRSGRIYNTTFNAPKVHGMDDITGEPLSRRPDDDPEIWKKRLKSFEETSIPLLEHYDKQGVVWTVTGNSSDEITPRLLSELKKRFGMQ